MSVFAPSHHGPTEPLIIIECHITEGLPSIIIVGFGNRAVDEAKERIRAAFHASKLTFPRKRITINLAPADVPKDGTGFDLGMSAAIMQACGAAPATPNVVWVGELGLNGGVRPVRGIIGQLLAAKTLGHKTFYIPYSNLEQAQLIPDITLFPIPSLKALHDHLVGLTPIDPIASHGIADQIGRQVQPGYEVTFEDIGGHERAKRMLEIAAAGGHNIMFSGPPGTGKSMLAKALASILPPLNHAEVLEVTQLHSLAGSRFDQIIRERPFRAPHHSASQVAVIGGGPRAKPGEVSLAHRGVLFLDEMPEFNRSTIEALRQPLEDKRITIARANTHTEYAADFMLVATCNPCPCGFHGAAASTTGQETQTCVCPPYEVIRYQRRLSGPLLDRIDLYGDVEAVAHAKLLSGNRTETSATVRARVHQARNVQSVRFGNDTMTNAQMSTRDLKQRVKLGKPSQELLNQAASRLNLSSRAYMRSIKVAQTIADLAGETTIRPEHIAEALQYRRQTQA